MPAWLRREREQWAPSAAVFRSNAGLAVKTALIGIFLCHALFLISGYTSPDGTNEGLFFFWNQRWALSLGRWMMEYLSESVYNVVMPPLYLAFNGLCAAGVILLLADLWKIRSRVFLVFGSLSLVVALAVIWQNLVIHVAYSYGFAMLMAVLAVYLIFSKRGAVSFGAAVVCLVLAAVCPLPGPVLATAVAGASCAGLLNKLLPAAGARTTPDPEEDRDGNAPEAE